MRQSPSARDRRCQGAPAAGGWPECSGRVLSTSGWQRCVPAGAVGGGHASSPPSLRHGAVFARKKKKKIRGFMLRPHRREETAPLGSGLGAQGQDSSVVRPGSCSSLSRHRCGQSKNPPQLALSPAGSLHSIPCRPRHPSASPILRLRGGSHPCVQPRLPIREARYPYRLPVGTSQADRDSSPMTVPLARSGHHDTTLPDRSPTRASPARQEDK